MMRCMASTTCMQRNEQYASSVLLSFNILKETEQYQNNDPRSHCICRFRSTPPRRSAAHLVCDVVLNALQLMTQGARAFTTVGVPLIVLCVGGFYGLSTLVQGRFEVQVELLACFLYRASFCAGAMCVKVHRLFRCLL